MKRGTPRLKLFPTRTLFPSSTITSAAIASSPSSCPARSSPARAGDDRAGQLDGERAIAAEVIVEEGKRVRVGKSLSLGVPLFIKKKKSVWEDVGLWERMNGLAQEGAQA